MDSLLPGFIHLLLHMLTGFIHLLCVGAREGDRLLNQDMLALPVPVLSPVSLLLPPSHFGRCFKSEGGARR